VVPVEELYKDLLERAGFRNVTVRTVRRRRSKTDGDIEIERVEAPS
jgi:hypothetical protein